METILNNLQEILNAHDNRITGEGVIMRVFAYASVGDLKDEVLKETPRRGFGLFVDAWSLWTTPVTKFSAVFSKFLNRFTIPGRNL